MYDHEDVVVTVVVMVMTRVFGVRIDGSFW
jgi:hypothetical protein